MADSSLALLTAFTVPLSGDSALAHVTVFAAPVRVRLVRQAGTLPATADGADVETVGELDVMALAEGDALTGVTLVDPVARASAGWVYRVFAREPGGSWEAAGGGAGPDLAASYLPHGVDARQLLVDRIDLGIQDLQRRQLLQLTTVVNRPRGVPPPPGGFAVAPPPSPKVVGVLAGIPYFDNVSSFPVVSVRVASDSSERFIGNRGSRDNGSFDPPDDYSELLSQTLDISAWSMNPDERSHMHVALRSILKANLSLLDAMGFLETTLQGQDVDMVEREPPVYATQWTLSYKAEGGVRSADTFDAPPGEPVDVTVDPDLGGVPDRDC